MKQAGPRAMLALYIRIGLIATRFRTPATFGPPALANCACSVRPERSGHLSAARAAGRHVGRDAGDGGDQRRDVEQHGRVARLDLEAQALEHPADGEDHGQPGGEGEAGGAESFTEHQPVDLGTACAERHPYADLCPAAG